MFIKTGFSQSLVAFIAGRYPYFNQTCRIETVYYSSWQLCDKVDIKYRVFNILLTSICKYLRIGYRDRQFLTPSQRHTASKRSVSKHLTPTTFRRNPYGRKRGIKAKDLCIVHSMLNTLCSPSSEGQRNKRLILIPIICNLENSFIQQEEASQIQQKQLRRVLRNQMLLVYYLQQHSQLGTSHSISRRIQISSRLKQVCRNINLIQPHPHRNTRQARLSLLFVSPHIVP